MNNFHRAIRKHFDNDADTTFAIMEVWGDMMKYVYEWGSSGESYVDVLVARLKKQIEVKTYTWENEDEYGDIDENNTGNGSSGIRGQCQCWTTERCY